MYSILFFDIFHPTILWRSITTTLERYLDGRTPPSPGLQRGAAALLAKVTWRPHCDSSYVTICAILPNTLQYTFVRPEFSRGVIFSASGLSSAADNQLCEKWQQQLICSSRIWQESADLSHSSNWPSCCCCLPTYLFSVQCCCWELRSERCLGWKSCCASSSAVQYLGRGARVSWCVIEEQCRGGRRHGSSDSPGIGPGKSPKQGQVMRIDDWWWIQMDLDGMD